MNSSAPYKEVESNLQSIADDPTSMQAVNYMQPPGYPQPNNVPQPAVNITPVTTPAVYPQQVGPISMEMTCPSCRSRIKTAVRHRSTAKTHIACLLLSWTCCCCCLPYCMDSCRNANHFCPMCGSYIGTYSS